MRPGGDGDAATRAARIAPGKAAEPLLPAGTMVAGRYRVVRPAGAGGMGVVYVVEHVNTGGLAALKIMRGGPTTPQLVERFKREARASGKIQSDHVVRVTDADVAPELGDAPFIVMELLDGEDLARYLTRKPVLDARETVDLLVQVARGLDRAHAAGVTHRDLKPQNIFLHRREDGTRCVKLVDFGISKLQPAHDVPESTGLTRPEELVGTPAWMSPEQAMSMHHAIGPQTDVWAVGLLAFCMLSGDSYWGDRKPTQIITALAATKRDAPSTKDPRFTEEFDRWFEKSCARDPAQRFGSVVKQVEQLAVALGLESPRWMSMPSLEEHATLPSKTSFPDLAELGELTEPRLAPAFMTDDEETTLTTGLGHAPTQLQPHPRAAVAVDTAPYPGTPRGRVSTVPLASPVTPPSPPKLQAQRSPLVTYAASVAVGVAIGGSLLYLVLALLSQT